MNEDIEKVADVARVATAALDERDYEAIIAEHYRREAERLGITVEELRCAGL